jgi:hypothetical protein
MSILKEELQQIPHLNVEAIGDRTVNLMSLWDGEQWHSWIPVGDKVMKVQMVDVAEGHYLAKSAARHSDLFIPFVDLMWQRASWPEIVPLVTAICDDFRNMGTSIAKLKHVFNTRHLLPAGAARTFASTELEYLVILARTIFDLLQEMMATIWDRRVRLTDPAAELIRKRRKLPDTFSSLCLKEKRTPRTVEEIEERFALPRAMAEQYAAAASFFLRLREVRDGVVHSGKDFDPVFETERGFCVAKRTSPFDAFNWQSHHAYNENLVSVLPWLSNIILQTIGTCTALMGAFASLIPLPEELAPGYRVFVRGPNNDALIEVLEIHEGKSPWWGPPPGEKQASN